jgi:hypothetical protein
MLQLILAKLQVFLGSIIHVIVDYFINYIDKDGIIYLVINSINPSMSWFMNQFAYKCYDGLMIFIKSL